MNILLEGAVLAPSYAHLWHLTDTLGVFEHAEYDTPRVEHGYCVDDVARALVVAIREPDQTLELTQIAEVSLTFLENAMRYDGMMHNRMDAAGEWTDAATIGDWWGRAACALGTAAVHAPLALTRARAMKAFIGTARRRSPDTRASAFAAIGAAEVLRVSRDSVSARRLLVDSLAVLPSAGADITGWAWPEARLRYANATLAEALILGGSVLGDLRMRDRGLALLRFLLDLESVPSESGTGTRLSVTGSRGRGPGEASPVYDQQPIEVAALADACARAFEATDDPQWRDGVLLSRAWFLGANDLDIPMYDPATGAGYDGLQEDGRNENRGAESTLAALGTLQQARRLENAA